MSNCSCCKKSRRGTISDYSGSVYGGLANLKTKRGDAPISSALSDVSSLNEN